MRALESLLAEAERNHQMTADGCACGRWESPAHYWTSEVAQSSRMHLLAEAQATFAAWLEADEQYAALLGSMTDREAESALTTLAALARSAGAQ